MKSIFLLTFIFLSVSFSQVLVPLKFQYYMNRPVESLSINIKNQGNYYHVWDYSQMTEIKINGDDTVLVRKQIYQAKNAALKFEYHTEIKQNLIPNSIKFVSDDSTMTHIVSDYKISSFTTYSGNKTPFKSSIDISELIFEDNNIDIILAQLSIKMDQSISIPVLLTDDSAIEEWTITFKGFPQININNKMYLTKLFNVKSGDSEDHYWLSREDNTLLRFESKNAEQVWLRQF